MDDSTGHGDGGKWVCGEYFPSTASKKDEDCVVISIGSNGQFDLELSLVEKSRGRCQIHTLDCTGQWEPPHPNIHFHPWCLSATDLEQEMVIANAAPGDPSIIRRSYRSWSSVIRDLQLQRIDLLKMDMEGYEWSTLPTLLSSSSTQHLLPRQLLLELHFYPLSHIQSRFGTDEKGKEYWQPPGTPEDMIASHGKDYLHPAIRLFELLDSRGYQVAATEFNRQSVGDCCQEFTLVRVESQ